MTVLEKDKCTVEEEIQKRPRNTYLPVAIMANERM